VVSGEGKRGLLGLRSSVGFAASVKPSKDPLGVNGPHVDRGIPDPTWGVFVPPAAHLTLTLSLSAPVVSTQDVRFRCVTPGPHRVYFGMGLICLGPHFNDQRTSYIFTGCLVKDRLAGRVELEVRGFDRETQVEAVGRGPYIIEFRFADVVKLEGFAGAGSVRRQTGRELGLATGRQVQPRLAFWQRVLLFFCACGRLSESDSPGV